MRKNKRKDPGEQDEHRSSSEQIKDLETLNAELLDYTERLRILFEHAPDAYYLSDLKGTFTDGNAAAEAMTGYARDELIGESFLRLKLLSPRDLRRAAALLARNAAGQPTGPDEFILNRKDGTQVSVEIRTHPVKISGQSLVLGIARDITERRQAEEGLRQYEFIVSSSQDLMTLIDSDYHYLAASDSFCTIHGKKREDILGQTVAEIWGERPFADSIKAHLDKCFTGDSAEFSGWFEVPVHGRRFYDVRYTPFGSPKSSAHYAVVISRDITTRKRVESALQESEERLQSIFTSMSEGIALHELIFDRLGEPVDYRIVEVNPAFESILGIPREDAVGSLATELYGSDDAPFLETYAEVAASGAPNTFETYFPPLGKHFLISVFSPGEGLFATVFTDVTARRRSEEALQKSEERFRSLYESMSEGVALREVILDDSGRAVDYEILDLNPAYEELTGVSREDAIGRRASAIYSGAEPPYLAVYRELLESGERATHFERHFPIMGKHFSISLVLLEEQQFVTVLSDITDVKMAEEATRQSEERLRSVIEQSIDGIVLVNSEGIVVEWNKGQEEITGIPAEQTLGQPFWEVQAKAVPEQRRSSQLANTLREVTETILQGAESSWANRFIDQEIQRADGEMRTIQIGSFPIDLGDRRMLGSVSRDITDRMRSEELLRASERRFRSVIEQAIDGLVLMGTDGRIIEWNKGQERITGILADEAVGQLSWDLQLRLLPESETPPSELLKRLRETTLALVAEDEVPGDLKLFEREIQRPDGTRRIVSIGNFAINLGESRMLGTVVRDITEHKAAELELQRYRVHLEELVEERTEALRAAIEAANAAMFRYDLLTGEVERDDRWFEIAGITESEFDGSHETWRRMVHPDDLPKAEARIEEAISSRSDSLEHEYRIARSDGEIRHIETRARILRDENGKAMTLLGMNIDITDRRNAEEALRENEAFLRTMIEHIPIDFFAVDRDLRYTMQSPTSRAAVGNMVGKRIDESNASEELKEQWATEHGQVFEGRSFEEENDVVTPSGEIRTYLSKIAPVYVGEQIIASIGTSIDITDRKRAREELKRLVEERTAELRASEERLLHVFEETVSAFARTVEARDPYTAGHQERVANLGVAIAMKMGLSETQVEGTRVSGLLHDIGKIAIPAELLTKPTKLTPLEFQMIQLHSVHAVEILRGINFPWPVADIVVQHHERIDGSGYPEGLKGEDILIEARILAVADTVEAMAAHRPYRPALGIKAALDVVREERGTTYDPDVVDACLELFEQDGYELPP